MKKLLTMLCVLLMLACAAMAEGEFPEMNEDGFLPEGEFLYENVKEGIWRYASPTLKIEIIRYDQKSPKRVWFEAEVWAAEGEVFDMIANDPAKRMKSEEYPYKIARKYGTVLAINTDYAQTRMNQKQTVGVIIRDGEIYSEKTKKQNAKGFPNLDTLAIFPDGNMEVFWSDEKTAQEYLDMGATDVLAFGPYLIRDGELNTIALEKYGQSKAQRTAIGMVEPGHYFVMMLEGRHSKSTGDGISFLAEKMMNRGCTLAFNLDGGATSAIVFMGNQLNISDGDHPKASARRTPEILGIGTSELVPELKK